METKLNSRLETVVQEQDNKIEELSKIILQLKNQIDRSEEFREVSKKTLLNAVDTSNNAGYAKPNSFEGLPTSCEDLSQLGHSLNGFYTVKGSNGILTVYCDFRKTPRAIGKNFN